MTITVLPTMPTPPNSVTRPGTFNADSDATFGQLPAVIEAYNANVPLLNQVLDTAEGTTATVEALVGQAEQAAAVAQQAAATAVTSPGSMATSISSHTVGAGVKVFTLVEAGKDFAPGQTVVAAYTPNPTINVLALVLAYDKPSRLLTLGVALPSGAGTYADWTISVSAGVTPMPRYSYDNRGQLRTAGGAAGAGATVEGLGLFIYVPGSTEIDDDESCFATASGRWLLEAVSYEFSEAWLSMGLASPGSATTVLHGRAICQVTSLASGAQTTFLGTVLGAAVGDRVLVGPSKSVAAVGISVYAWVSAANTVTVTISMPGATGGATGTGMDGIWLISVFKEG